MEDFDMVQFTDIERTAQMNDIRSFDEKMLCLGIFSTDLANRRFLGVRKKKIIVGVYAEIDLSEL